MSINVTVSGNPVSIKRGKMVTCDPNFAKKEFEKRRLMRLEQVRQQSKNIAEDVRNKVRSEKKKQMNQIEEEGKEKLRNWQNRKLLELQTQYKEALRELGTGHKEAVELEGEDEVQAEHNEYNRDMANHRSHVAATHLQMEKEKKQTRKSVPIQQKKIVRNIEKTRASLVSNIKKKNAEISEPNNKKNKRRRASADINISIPELDSENGDVHEESEEEIDVRPIEDEVNSLDERSEDSEEPPREPLNMNKNSDFINFNQGSLQNFSHEITADRMSPSPQPTEMRKHFMEYYRETAKSQLAKTPPVDTRISDRIKRRDIMASQVDYCETVAETNPTPYVESNTKIRDAIDSRYFRKSPDRGGFCTCSKGQTVCSSTCGKSFITDRSQDIPTKPPVKLKETDNISKGSKSNVEKITTDSLEVNPNVTSEAEWQEKIRQRDKEARIRGQKALEKERIQKDYEDMMKKLPLLQKKERISQITRDKPKYHMGEERLKEKERERQNKLDNAYSKLFPNFKPTIVTLPRTKKPEQDVRKYADDEPVQSINVGKWDVDHEQKMFTAEEVQEIIRAFTEHQKPKDRQAKLKELLRSLKLQKDQLLEEIKFLPKDDSITQLINDLNSFSDSDENVKTDKGDKSERKRRHEENEKEMSGDSATDSSSSSQTKISSNNNKEKKKSKRPESSKVPSPRKKAKTKSRRKVLILQNMSTQTTPKVSSSSEDKQSNEAKQFPTCSKLHIPCDCNKENEGSTEDLCHILIKLNDNEEPEIVVKGAEKEKKDEERPKYTSPASPKTKSKSIAVGTDDIEMRPLERDSELFNVSSKVTQTVLTTDKTKSTSRKSKSESRKDKSEARRSVSSRIGDDSKSKPWKEQLSKNSFSTASTSYYSPPDFGKIEDIHLIPSMSDVTEKSMYNLRKKPQQGNLHEISLTVSESRSSSPERTIEPQLLKYIKKLLGKSRESIENLTVSTSDIPTPSPSIVEVDSNNPMAELHNIIKYFNLRTADIARELSYSSEHSLLNNTSASSSEKQMDRSKGATGARKETSLHPAVSRNAISSQYADITDSCSKKIATLAAMINQIREEKIQMLNKSLGGDEKSRPFNAAGSDREHSSAYLDLPDSKEGSKHSLNSLDDEELHKRLTEVDLSLAKKLRKFSPLRETSSGEDKNKEAAEGQHDSIHEYSSIDSELWARLKRLMRQEIRQAGPSASSTRTEGNTENNLHFVPFLSDIPMLPKLEIQIDSDASNSSTHKRPPPSKGLTVAKKYNGNISLVPHELSTIVEADSQLSTKMGSNQASPNGSKASRSPRKGLSVPVRREVDEELQTSYHSVLSKYDENAPDIITEVSKTVKRSSGRQVEADKSRESSNKTISPINLSYDVSSKSIILDKSGSKSTISAKKSILLSSSSSDGIDSFEAMLRSIGMEWAIPTLHKTQEALALTSSSSSSLDISSKKTTKGYDLGGSEVNLKEYLRKQVFNKVSSSTLRSGASPASMLSEFSELSSIHMSSKEKKEDRKTSTPLTGSKSSKSKFYERRVVFSGDSDISSVRDEPPPKHSEKYSYCSLSENSVSKNDY